MSGKVIFSLTETQAAVLVAIGLGERVRAESPSARERLVETLKRKGLVLDQGAGLGFTEIGRDAAALCTSLLRAKLNGRGP